MSSIDCATDGSFLFKIANVLKGTLDTDGNLTLLGRLLGPYMPPVGQCYLRFSGANIVMNRERGSLLTINGRHETIPAAGVTLAPITMAANSDWNIYAYMDTGVMKLGFSPQATGRSIGADGQQIITGQPGWTLVGKFHCITANQLNAGNQSFLQLLNWFNRKKIAAFGAFAAVRNWSSASFAELDAALRCAWLSWGVDGDAPTYYLNGSVYSNSAGSLMQTAFALDSGSVNNDVSEAYTTPGSNYYGPLAMSRCINTPLSEGWHYGTALCWTNAGTGTWNANLTLEVPC